MAQSPRAITTHVGELVEASGISLAQPQLQWPFRMDDLSLPLCSFCLVSLMPRASSPTLHPNPTVENSQVRLWGHQMVSKDKPQWLISGQENGS